VKDLTRTLRENFSFNFSSDKGIKAETVKLKSKGAVKLFFNKEI